MKGRQPRGIVGTNRSKVIASTCVTCHVPLKFPRVVVRLHRSVNGSSWAGLRRIEINGSRAWHLPPLSQSVRKTFINLVELSAPKNVLSPRSRHNRGCPRAEGPPFATFIANPPSRLRPDDFNEMSPRASSMASQSRSLRDLAVHHLVHAPPPGMSALFNGTAGLISNCDDTAAPATLFQLPPDWG